MNVIFKLTSKSWRWGRFKVDHLRTYDAPSVAYNRFKTFITSASWLTRPRLCGLISDRDTSLNELSSTPSAGDEENKMAPLLAVIGFPTDELIGWRFQQTTRSAEHGETVTRVSKCYFRNLNSSEIISHKLRLLVASNVWFNIFSPVGGDTEGLRGRTAARQQLAGSIPKLWDAEADAAHDIGLVSQVLFSSWAPELLRERSFIWKFQKIVGKWNLMWYSDSAWSN